MLCIRGDKQPADYQVTLYEGKYSSRIALCGDCYELYKPSMPMAHVKALVGELTLTASDWQRILRRYALPGEGRFPHLLILF